MCILYNLFILSYHYFYGYLIHITYRGISYWALPCLGHYLDLILITESELNPRGYYINILQVSRFYLHC